MFKLRTYKSLRSIKFHVISKGSLWLQYPIPTVYIIHIGNFIVAMVSNLLRFNGIELHVFEFRELIITKHDFSTVNP